jgi:FkbM family methyltransferase
MRTIGINDIASMDRYRAEAEIRGRVQTVNVGGELILTRVLGNPKMFLHQDDIGFSNHVMLDGYWEIWLTLALARLIKPGMVVVDVGANLGYYSLLAAHAAWPGGTVLAIEPNPPIAQIMARSINLNGLSNVVRIENVAVGATDGGSCDLFVPHGEPKNATVVEDQRVHPGGRTLSVPRRTIDSLCADMNRIDLVKIDAEGAEQDILLGMANTIERHKPTIVLEFNAARYADPAAFLERITAVYGMPRLIDFEGELVRTTVEKVLHMAVDEDKLLIFSVGR